MHVCPCCLLISDGCVHAACLRLADKARVIAPGVALLRVDARAGRLPDGVSPSLQLSTLNPQPSTLNPQPSTLNPQPSTLSSQASSLKPQLGVAVLYLDAGAGRLPDGGCPADAWHVWKLQPF